jgi:hypothetical protein
MEGITIGKAPVAYVGTLTSPGFDVPTTVAPYKGSFTCPTPASGRSCRRRPPETAEYWITRIDR